MLDSHRNFLYKMPVDKKQSRKYNIHGKMSPQLATFFIKIVQQTVTLERHTVVIYREELCDA